MMTVSNSPIPVVDDEIFDEEYNDETRISIGEGCYRRMPARDTDYASWDDCYNDDRYEWS